MKPVATLYSWFNEHKDYFVSRCSEIEFKDTGRSSACVSLETEAYIMSLCAWDHACCLDIQIMEIQSEKITFPHTGDCASIEELKSYLYDFLEWFKNEARENA